MMLALAGCAASGGWTKPGASESEFYQARYTCQSQAAAAYPVAMTQMGPGVQTPGRVNCTTIGIQTNCTAQPTQTLAAPMQDVNFGARMGMFQSCMRAGGWQWGR